MGYLKCQKCGGYYKLHDGESLNDFAQCSCGGSLIYTESIDESKVHGDDLKISTASGKTEKFERPESEEKKHSNIELSRIGLIIMFIGLFCLIFAFFYPLLSLVILSYSPDSIPAILIQTVWIYLTSFILMILGVFIFLIGSIGNTGEKKHTKTRFAEYLKEIPDSHTVFQNVRIPKTRSLIGLVIIGPNGIFIIHNRRFRGNFIIRNDEWWRLKGNQRVKPVSNPGKIVKMNTVDLKKFLNSHNVNVDYKWITPVVSVPQNQYTVEEEPQNYYVVPPAQIKEFIIRQKKTMAPELMMKSIALIARYSS
jgi:hypothetical protein